MPAARCRGIVMAPDVKPSPLMFRLLNLLDAVRRLSPFSTLTAEEEQLLFRLVLRWEGVETFTVGDIMKEDSSASPSSLYRRLCSLRDKGMVELAVDKADRRVKYVRPTPLSAEFVRQFNAGLSQAFPVETPA